MFTGPRTINDGLIFSYDTANKKSFKGAPTTNIVTNTDLDTGWSKSYNTSIKWNDIPPPTGIDSPVVSFYDADTNQSGYWFSYGDYAPQVPGETYTISLYVKTRDSNFRIKAYTADNAEVGRMYTNEIVVPNDNKWHRVVFNPITNPSNSTSDSLSFNFQFGNTQGESQRTWLCAPQMEPGTYTTPFVAGTRSATESLYDLTGNVNLDITSAGFDSNGLYFDRPSYNRINTFFGNGVNPTTTPFTVEAVVKANTIETNPMWISATGWGSNQRFYSSITTSDTRRTGIQGTLWSSGEIPDTDYHHQVIVMDGSNALAYDNGVLAQTIPYTSYVIPSDLYFGSGNNTHSWNGLIPIGKIYNGTLTPQQVKQNFNAIKSRFNIQ